MNKNVHGDYRSMIDDKLAFPDCKHDDSCDKIQKNTKILKNK